MPRIFVIGLAKKNNPPAKTMLPMRANEVIIFPKSFANNKLVARTAGPTINGIPNGTAPRLFVSILRCRFSPAKRSANEIVSSKSPQAMVKSEMLMLKNFKSA
jgi:hypothetical protein